MGNVYRPPTTQLNTSSPIQTHRIHKQNPVTASIHPLAPLVQGKKFTCTECGKCCTGAGEVWANAAEVTAMAKSRGAQESYFLKTFTKSYTRRPGWYLLARKPSSGDCIFLASDNKTCTIYNARPLQCFTFPFWPELMDDRQWIAAAEDCEGINHPDATEVNVDEAAVLLQQASEYTAVFDEAGMGRSEPRKQNRKRR